MNDLLHVYETKEESLKAYNISICNHIQNIKKAFNVFGKLFCDALNLDINELEMLINIHDKSKMLNQDEIDGYLIHNFPYKDSNIPFNSYGLRRCIYEKALLSHYHSNPHHPEYWVMIKNNSLLPMPMEKIYICEMVLDWIANSVDENTNAKEYWRLNRNRKLLHHDTIDIIDQLIDLIDPIDFNKLDLKNCLDIDVHADGV